jgi:UDP-N-acetylglucosamine--N-acetylmuramyl-(pentapeptide) pyrophosphoryl-undecaprenol N-acetylglucosamine transferase
MRYLITGGGTGGHVNPGLAIAREIRQRDGDAQILFVGTERGIEKELVPRAGFDIEYIDVKGFRRKLSADTFKTLYKLIRSFSKVGEILNSFNPDIVIGTGGYVCGPVVFRAALKKIPTLIHEQNAYPGVTNRILARYVNTVAISFEESRQRFRGKAKIVFTGNPVRGELFSYDRKTARERLGIANSKPLVMVYGGSMGASTLNKCIVDMLNASGGNPGFNIIYATGMRLYDEVMAGIKAELSPDVRIVPYIFNMDEVMAAADVAVCRSGAITLSELAALGVPSILIPSPYVAENHQEYNARAFEARGAAVVILERQLDHELMLGEIRMLIEKHDQRHRMAQAAQQLGIRDSAQRICDLIDELIKK